MSSDILSLFDCPHDLLTHIGELVTKKTSYLIEYNGHFCKKEGVWSFENIEYIGSNPESPIKFVKILRQPKPNFKSEIEKFCKIYRYWGLSPSYSYITDFAYHLNRDASKYSNPKQTFILIELDGYKRSKDCELRLHYSPYPKTLKSHITLDRYLTPKEFKVKVRDAKIEIIKYYCKDGIDEEMVRDHYSKRNKKNKNIVLS